MPFLWLGDWTWIMILPALFFAMWAQSKVQSTYARYSRVPARSRVSGAQVAREILNNAGLEEIGVERVAGQLTDHYDPRKKVLRLSAGVYESNSLAALGVAAHEAGHAIQHDLGYAPLVVRNQILPVAQFGSGLAFPLFFIGFIFSNTFGFLMDLGILFFLGAVIFQVVTLPVEFNASSRALELLEASGFLTREEVGPTKRVLDAAAMTYVAATAVAVTQLLRLLVLRGMRDE